MDTTNVVNEGLEGQILTLINTPSTLINNRRRMKKPVGIILCKVKQPSIHIFANVTKKYYFVMKLVTYKQFVIHIVDNI
jgi:hypothetical protein